MFFVSQVIFGELFQLPVPPHIDVTYTTLLIELCKLQPGSLPQVVSFFIVCPIRTSSEPSESAGLKPAETDSLGNYFIPPLVNMSASE